MSLERWTVWCPNDGDEPVEWTQLARSASSAAALWVERMWSSLDMPEEVTVHVRAMNGALTAWIIRCEQVVSFSTPEEVPPCAR